MQPNIRRVRRSRAVLTSTWRRRWRPRCSWSTCVCSITWWSRRTSWWASRNVGCS